jgi:hypothetical protein
MAMREFILLTDAQGKMSLVQTQHFVCAAKVLVGDEKREMTKILLRAEGVSVDLFCTEDPAVILQKLTA